MATDRPIPADESVRRRMSRQARKDTAPELALRRELHRRGLRYRIGVRPIRELRGAADIVFRPVRVAVYVDGCFWHMCPEHGTFPANNAGWWRAKLERNRDRDRRTDIVLAEHGWTVVRVWEHEDPAEAADRVESVVGGAREAANGRSSSIRTRP
jgi:DNA mismatch endonuclease, patch repair protein